MTKHDPDHDYKVHWGKSLHKFPSKNVEGELHLLSVKFTNELNTTSHYSLNDESIETVVHKMTEHIKLLSGQFIFVNKYSRKAF